MPERLDNLWWAGEEWEGGNDQWVEADSYLLDAFSSLAPRELELGADNSRR
jgi:hypothetical protein